MLKMNLKRSVKITSSLASAGKNLRSRWREARRIRLYDHAAVVIYNKYGHAERVVWWLRVKRFIKK